MIIDKDDDMIRVNFEGEGVCEVSLRALGFKKKKCCPRVNPKRNGNGKKKGKKKLQKT